MPASVFALSSTGLFQLSSLPLVKAAKVGPKAFSYPVNPPAEEILPQAQRPGLLLAVLIEVEVAIPVQIAETMIVDFKDIGSLALLLLINRYVVVLHDCH